MVIPDENHIIDVYFIELKISPPDPNKIESKKYKAYEQILYTIPLWKYMLSMIRINNIEKQTVLEKIKKFEIEQHFVVIIEIRDRIPKNKPRPDPSLDECEHKGKNFKIIQSLPDISFKYLKCQTLS